MIGNKRSNEITTSTRNSNILSHKPRYNIFNTSVKIIVMHETTLIKTSNEVSLRFQ